jgi:hypothetical protein
MLCWLMAKFHKYVVLILPQCKCYVDWWQKFFTLGMFEIHMMISASLSYGWHYSSFCYLIDRLPAFCMQFNVSFLIWREQSFVGGRRFGILQRFYGNYKRGSDSKYIKYVGLAFWIYASWIEELNVLKIYPFLLVVQCRISCCEMQVSIFASSKARNCVVLYVRRYCQFSCNPHPSIHGNIQVCKCWQSAALRPL